MNYRERRMMEGDIRCHNTDQADIRFQDGALPHVKGACCYQVVRASKNLKLSPEGYGFTYNHAGMLAYFQNTFLYEYLGGPREEHEAPSSVFICKSPDGIHWEKPVEAFPAIEVSAAPYCGPKKEMIKAEKVPCITHHRMGFFTSSEGRLLLMTFYGISPDFHTAPNNGYGVGRAVREIYPDFSMSEIYFLRYNLPGGFNGNNTDRFPYFEDSGDDGFKKACRELLKNRLVAQQWWEEERLDETFFSCPGGRALSYYTLPDGRVMGVFKDSLTSITADKGEHWSAIKKSASIETSSGKVWGQKTADGRYALVYNPSSDSAHRWPLAVVTGENGIDFDRLAAIVPEVPPCRYAGALKNLGPQYVRGIAECNVRPDDAAMWVVYSMNKEDMWISRVPVPVCTGETKDVHEIMNDMTEKELRDCWNLFVPAWNSAELAAGSDGGRALRLTDCDPYHRTRAMRLFKPGTLVEVYARVRVEGSCADRAAVFLQDDRGQNIISVVFRPDGWVCAHNAGYDTPLCRFEGGNEVELKLRADCVENRVTVEAHCMDEGKSVDGYAAASASAVERVLFATKYELPWQGLEVNGRLGDIGDMPGADEKWPETVFSILELTTKTLEI